VDWSLEVVIMPVSDVDAAKAFYSDKLGFHVDVDFSAGEHFRIVQLTPPGSHCSITLMKNPESAGNVSGLHLVVADIDAARAELVGRGAEVSELYHHTETGETPGPHPGRDDYGTFMSLKDPDGNGWLVQEVPSRAGAEVGRTG
jgi:catechol 2,3-dioxygenase-like lactoylglutathione lyase family enzyme